VTGGVAIRAAFWAAGTLGFQKRISIWQLGSHFIRTIGFPIFFASDVLR
jgi:hypothetical protein